MAQSPEEMAATMRANVPEKTGKTLPEWFVLLGQKGLARHGEMVKVLKNEHGVGHGFANLIVHDFLNAGKDENMDPVAAHYTGKKEHLRPIYEAVVALLPGLGDDIEISPKKAYVSLRRNKQFATVGPATNTAIEVGMNLKGVAATARLKAAKGGMVSHSVRLSDVAEIDRELEAWLEKAYQES